MKRLIKIAKIAIIITLCICFLGVLGCTIVALEAYSGIFDRIEGHRDDKFYFRYTWKDIEINIKPLFTEEQIQTV